MPNIKYSSDERCWILKQHIRGLSHEQIRVYFEEVFEHSAPSVKTIGRILKDFKTKANASKEPQHRPPLQYPCRQLSEIIKLQVVALAALSETRTFRRKMCSPK